MQFQHGDEDYTLTDEPDALYHVVHNNMSSVQHHHQTKAYGEEEQTFYLNTAEMDEKLASDSRHLQHASDWALSDYWQANTQLVTFADHSLAIEFVAKLFNNDENKSKSNQNELTNNEANGLATSSSATKKRNDTNAVRMRSGSTARVVTLAEWPETSSTTTSSSSSLSSSYMLSKIDLVFVKGGHQAAKDRKALTNSIKYYLLRNLFFLNFSVPIKVFAVDLPLSVLQQLAIVHNDADADSGHSTMSSNSLSNTGNSSLGGSGSHSLSEQTFHNRIKEWGASNHVRYSEDHLDNLIYEMVTYIARFQQSTPTSGQNLATDQASFSGSLYGGVSGSSLTSSSAYMFVLVSYHQNTFRHQLVYSNSV